MTQLQDEAAASIGRSFTAVDFRTGLPIRLAFAEKIGMIANRGGMKSLVEYAREAVRHEFETALRIKSVAFYTLTVESVLF